MDTFDLSTLILARLADAPESTARQFPTGGDYMIDSNLADCEDADYLAGRVGGAFRAHALRSRG